MIIQLEDETVYIILKSGHNIALDGVKENVQLDGKTVSMNELVFAFRNWNIIKNRINTKDGKII